MVRLLLSLNLHRRHLTSDQKAVCAVEALPFLKEEAAQRQKCGFSADGTAGGRGRKKNLGQKIDEGLDPNAGRATVKPITYQHQAGQTYVNEMSAFHRTVLRDFTPQEFTPVMYRILGLDEAPWDDLVATGLGPSSYVGGQCRDTVAALDGDLPVYMQLYRSC